MSKKELKKWESKLKFWMVMNDKTLEDVLPHQVCLKFNCPLSKGWLCEKGNIKLLFLVTSRRENTYNMAEESIKLENMKMNDMGKIFGRCVEWIKYV